MQLCVLFTWSLNSFFKLQQHLALLELFPYLMLKSTTANTHANNPVEKKNKKRLMRAGTFANKLIKDL